jgi:hypothetical protein
MSSESPTPLPLQSGPQSSQAVPVLTGSAIQLVKVSNLPRFIDTPRIRIRHRRAAIADVHATDQPGVERTVVEPDGRAAVTLERVVVVADLVRRLRRHRAARPPLLVIGLVARIPGKLAPLVDIGATRLTTEPAVVLPIGLSRTTIIMS